METNHQEKGVFHILGHKWSYVQMSVVLIRVCVCVGGGGGGGGGGGLVFSWKYIQWPL